MEAHMTPAEVLSSYEHIVELTNKMLDAARNDDWDDFSLLEHQCAVESKRMLDATIPALAGAACFRKLELLKQILANDREIRSITEPWMEQLANVMTGLSLSHAATPQAVY